MSVWTINGSTPEALGLRVVSGVFRTGGASTVTLERFCDFAASEALAYGATVTIVRDAAVFFRGKCRSIPKSADGNSQSHGYMIEDAWADLERTVYQEPWGAHGGVFLSPTVILGMSSAGARIGVGTQIAEVLTFAASAGVAIQAGSIPDGMMLWPSEATGLSCAEVIRTSLRFYPDWVAWIDHSTSPPTFNVTPRASATARNLPVTDCTGISVTKTSDRVPECVRIVFLTANMVGDEVFRDGSVQKYPVLGADSGPGVLTTVIELAGMEVQVEKQQIQVRPLPEDQTTAKAYLKLKFPGIAAVADASFNVTEWVDTVLPDDEELPPAIDTKMERQKGTTRTHLPNELVKGSVKEWMRKRVGKVLIDLAVVPTSTATVEEIGKLAKLPPNFTVVATNAVTKIYKGVSSYVAGELAPPGIAQAYYETLAAGCYFEGHATITGDDVGATRWHGSCLNLTGGLTEWGTMKAPIHSVAWDLQSRKVDISFGPNPDYAVQDFLEFLRLLNRRPHNDITTAERTGNTLGVEAGISAKGDTVGPFDVPETITGAVSAPVGQFEVYGLGETSGVWKCRVKQGQVLTIDPEPGAVMGYIPTTPAETTEHTVSAGTKLWCKVTTAKDDIATAAEIMTGAAPVDVHAQPDPGGVLGTYHYLIADFEDVGGRLKVKTQYHSGGPVIHRPARNNRNLDLVVTVYEEDSEGYLIPAAPTVYPKIISFRQGVFVGLDAGAADNLVVVNIMTLEELRALDLP